jgi:HNH endonuclease/Homing endonuclease associated repeat
MGSFSIDFLDEYTDEALLGELKRVASIAPQGPLTRKVFQSCQPKASASTIQQRFGSWENALLSAGLGERYRGPKITEKLRKQIGKRLSKDDVIAELRRVHRIVGTISLSANDFNPHSTIEEGTVYSRFTSWPKALIAAGIPEYQKAAKHADVECFENLADTWSHLGRQPHYKQMLAEPSTISPKCYVRRWGTWRKALKAFVEWSSSQDGVDESQEIAPVRQEPLSKPKLRSFIASENCREVRPGLRFRVFQRDRFRCVSCGKSPATNLSVELHADHILAVALGGKTVLENLQTLCNKCNLGKGKLRMHSHASI